MRIVFLLYNIQSLVHLYFHHSHGHDLQSALMDSADTFYLDYLLAFPGYHQALR